MVFMFMICRFPSIRGSNHSISMVRLVIRLSNLVPKGYALKSVSIPEEVIHIAMGLELSLTGFLR